jgi:hypothetical protein
MAILRRAIDAGFRDAPRLASDPELIPLRSRADFQTLRMDIEFPADPFARWDEGSDDHLEQKVGASPADSVFRD